MEKKCEYCLESFVPKRKDMKHCSDSCRQMAYVKRKQGVNNLGLKNQNPSIDVFHQDHETSTHQEKASISKTESVNNNEESSIDGLTDREKTSTGNHQGVNSESEASIDGLKKSADLSTKDEKSVNKIEKASIDASKNVNETSTLSVNQSEKASTIEEKSVNSNDQKPSIDTSSKENDEVQSTFVQELMDLFIVREAFQNELTFHAPYTGGKPVGWISVRFRCILECLLTFSEMKEIEPDDLKEVCNALIAMSASNNFKLLPQYYPYREDILELKELLKSVCMKIGGADKFRFRLKRETKIQLIMLRSELAMYFPKRAFKELDFRQKL